MLRAIAFIVIVMVIVIVIVIVIIIVIDLFKCNELLTKLKLYIRILS